MYLLKKASLYLCLQWSRCRSSRNCSGGKLLLVSLKGACIKEQHMLFFISFCSSHSNENMIKKLLHLCNAQCYSPLGWLLSISIGIKFDDGIVSFIFYFFNKKIESYIWVESHNILHIFPWYSMLTSKIWKICYISEFH